MLSYAANHLAVNGSEGVLEACLSVSNAWRLKEYHELDISERKKFRLDRKSILKKARDAKPKYGKKLKIKAWEFFESGDYGTNKSKACDLMEDDLKAYSGDNYKSYWPANYREFIYNKTLCREKPKTK